jgi:hypothetical protein
LNLRPLGYEPSELPNCSTPRRCLYCMNSRPHKQIGVAGDHGGVGRDVPLTARAKGCGQPDRVRDRPVSGWGSGQDLGVLGRLE